MHFDQFRRREFITLLGGATAVTRGAFAGAIRSTVLTAMPKQLKIVRVNDKMQRGYRYVLTAPIGRNFDPEFRPELTPKEMLALGVFCGKYMTDCGKEFPASWFAHARLSPSGRDCSLNYFSVDASQPLSVWRDKGWIHPNDPRGWFQWYCRYSLGQKIEAVESWGIVPVRRSLGRRWTNYTLKKRRVLR
jgi:hypothetical protein